MLSASILAMACGGVLNPFEILAPDHQIHVSGQRSEFRFGIFDMHQDRKPTDQFIGHALIRENFCNFVQHANKIEQPFFKQGIDRFPFRGSSAQELFEGDDAHRSLQYK